MYGKGKLSFFLEFWDLNNIFDILDLLIISMRQKTLSGSGSVQQAILPNMHL